MAMEHQPPGKDGTASRTSRLKVFRKRSKAWNLVSVNHPAPYCHPDGSHGGGVVVM